MPIKRVIITGSFEFENLITAPSQEDMQNMVDEYLNSFSFRSNKLIELENMGAEFQFKVKFKNQEENHD